MHGPLSLSVKSTKLSENHSPSYCGGYLHIRNRVRSFHHDDYIKAGAAGGCVCWTQPDQEKRLGARRNEKYSGNLYMHTLNV